MPKNISKIVGELLLKKQMTVAVAESCSGGLLSGLITDTPGSSFYFLGGVVAYDNRVKTSLLNISTEFLKKSGAVSPGIAAKMAQNIRKRLKTDYGLGITGIAGPSGGSRAKPVGLVYIALASKKEIWARKYIFLGKRSTVRTRAAREALNLLRLELLKNDH